MVSAGLWLEVGDRPKNPKQTAATHLKASFYGLHCRQTSKKVQKHMSNHPYWPELILRCRMIATGTSCWKQTGEPSWAFSFGYGSRSNMHYKTISRNEHTELTAIQFTNAAEFWHIHSQINGPDQTWKNLTSHQKRCQKFKAAGPVLRRYFGLATASSCSCTLT